MFKNLAVILIIIGTALKSIDEITKNRRWEEWQEWSYMRLEMEWLIL